MKSVNKKSNPGLAKLPQDVRNKMGYMQKGGKATKKYAMGGMGSEDEQFFGEEELAAAAKRPTYAESTKLDERDKREMAIQKRVREKAETFGEAFNAARKDPEAMKKGYFTYKGKRYSVDTKEEAAKKKAASKKEGTKSTAKKPPDMKAGPSRLRSGAKAVAEKNPGDFDRMMEERAREKAKKKKSEPMTMTDIIGAKKGGMMKKYNVGGMVKSNCGASMKPNGGSRNK
jgi:hypothetical protein